MLRLVHNLEKKETKINKRYGGNGWRANAMIDWIKVYLCMYRLFWTAGPSFSRLPDSLTEVQQYVFKLKTIVSSPSWFSLSVLCMPTWIGWGGLVELGLGMWMNIWLDVRRCVCKACNYNTCTDGTSLRCWTVQYFCFAVFKVSKLEWVRREQGWIGWNRWFCCFGPAEMLNVGYTTNDERLAEPSRKG
jgi:hypothetical protein